MLRAHGRARTRSLSTFICGDHPQCSFQSEQGFVIEADPNSYADWIALNEPRILLMHRGNSQLDLSHYSEAIGDLMRLDLVVDQDSAASCIAYAPKGARNVEPLDEVTTNLPIGDLLPPIFFHGRSQQHHDGVPQPGQSPASFVRGVVQLTADDPPQVRWTLIIRYGGDDRWRLECVQPGGRGSTRGFFGVSWTCCCWSVLTRLARSGRPLTRKSIHPMDRSGIGEPELRT